jgi:hypothetical protein
MLVVGSRDEETEFKEEDADKEDEEGGVGKRGWFEFAE